MKAKPVGRSPSPAYPTRGELLSNVDLLGTRLPRRWQLGKDVAGAAAILLAANFGGCADKPSGAGLPPPAVVAEAASERSGGTKATVAKGRTVVAPIFEHGEGRGATGCMVMSPPVFLSEEEAMQMIREELGKEGISLKTDVPLKNTKFVPRSDIPESSEGSGVPDLGKRPPVPVPLVVDGLDLQKRIAVKFVSYDEYEELNLPKPYVSSASSYDFKATARHLVDEIGYHGGDDLHLGVFYDPAAKYDNSDVHPPQARSQGLALLREQVQDFIAWLKEQKAL